MQEPINRTYPALIVTLAIFLVALTFLAIQPALPASARLLAQLAHPAGEDNLLTDVVQIDSGNQRACALTNAGAVLCWGEDYGLRPKVIPGLESGAKFLVVDAEEAACALLTNGEARCWGNNRYGQVGDGTGGSRYTATSPVGLGSGVKSIDVSTTNSCAVTSAGAAKCWGRNYAGQVGDGTTEDRYVPTQVIGLESGVKSIGAGLAFACALKESGAVVCWGANYGHFLGDGTDVNRSSPTPVVGLSSGVSSIAVGRGSSCAILESGAVRCWGSGAGAYNEGGFETTTIPREVEGLPGPAIAVSVGGDGFYDEFFCALVSGGALYCWGGNRFGQLGDGTFTERSDVAPVFGLESGVISMGAGSYQVCAALSDGTARCWGDVASGSLGDGRGFYTWPPVEVTAFGAVREIALGSTHGCALTTGGGVKCAGDGRRGGLGDGTRDVRSEPKFVTGLETVVKNVHVTWEELGCALLETDEVQCWGDNLWGGLGTTVLTETFSLTPTTVMSLPVGAALLSTSNRHSCALTTEGGLKCWGDNEHGQLGDGTTESRSTPVDVAGLTSGVKWVDTASTFYLGDKSSTCAVTNAGGVKCWGGNVDGYLGVGSNEDQHTPIDIPGLTSGVQSVSTNHQVTCVLTTQGGVKCWGDGILGDGTDEPSKTPVDVVGLQSGVKVIAIESENNCALKEDGTVWCWGDSTGPNFDDVYEPIMVPGLGGKAVSIAVGWNRACAVLEDNTLKCWGRIEADLGANPGWLPVSVLAPQGEAPVGTATPTPPEGTPVYLPAISGREGE